MTVSTIMGDSTAVAVEESSYFESSNATTTAATASSKTKATNLDMNDDESTTSEGSSSSSSSYDAFLTTFDRGSWLRKLRELELQDEAERQAELEEDNGNNTSNNGNTNKDPNVLQYSEYLSNQGYYDDYKHVNYQYIDFGYFPNRENTTTNQGMLSEEQRCDSCLSMTSLEKSLSSVSPSGDENTTTTTLLLEQARNVGKGGLVWDAGYILGEHLIHTANDWNRSSSLLDGGAAGQTTSTTTTTTSVLELGAGTGVTGYMVAKSFPTTTNVHLTDLSELLPLLEKNREHTSTQHNTSVFELKWGCEISTSSSTTSSPAYSTYDVIIGADVVASIYSLQALLQTIYEKSNENTIVYMSTKDRITGTCQELITQLSQCFVNVQHVKPTYLANNKNPEISIIIAYGKRQTQ